MLKLLLKTTKVIFFLFFVFTFLSLLKPQSLYASSSDPCKWCQGGVCYDGLSPPHCTPDNNECTSTYGCGEMYCVQTCWTPTPTATQPPTLTPTLNPNDCYCTGDKNCYDRGLGGTSCNEQFSTSSSACGTQGCPPYQKPYTSWCGPIGTGQNCGMRCVTDPQCNAIGQCSGGSCYFAEDPNHGCGGYCNSCSRQIGIYWCWWDGSWRDCGEQCKPDSFCGVGCGGTGTATPTNPPAGKSCTVSLLPATASASTGSLVAFTASVTVTEGTVDNVLFSSNNTGVATVNPAVDSSPTYSTNVSAVAEGNAIITADVMMGPDLVCSDTSSIVVVPSGPWWQVKDSDVSTNGDLVSLIPATCTLPGCNPVFNLKGTGTFPGVSLVGATADFAAGSGQGKAAEDPNNWLVNTSYQGKTYDYAYFARQIPADVSFTEVTDTTVNGGFFQSGGAPSRGYIWYHYNGNTLGDLTMNGNLNLNGTRKVVLLVEGANFYLNSRIIIQRKGEGFFMVVVGKNANGLKGNIFVDPSVSDIEGLFLAEGSFHSGVTGSNQGPLHVTGSVVAYDGIALERDLGQPGNDTDPSELFEYSPELMSVFPQVFTSRRMRWKEVAP